MGSDESTKYPTWKWILMLAITIIAFLASKGISSIEEKIDSKLDTVIYNSDKLERENDIKEIKESITAMRLEMLKNTQATTELTTALIIHDPKVANFLRDRK